MERDEQLEKPTGWIYESTKRKIDALESSRQAEMRQQLKITS